MDKDESTVGASEGHPAPKVIVPKADPMMIYDALGEKVVDRRNGDWLSGRSSDRERGGMYFKLVSSNNELLYTFDVERKLIDLDGSRAMAFKVLRVMKGKLPMRESFQYAEDLSLERFGRFIVKHPESNQLQAKKVVLFDYRERYRSAP